jgi:hypothetical protein
MEIGGIGIMSNREMRNIIFMVLAVVLSVLMCISSIANGAIFAIVVGLCLMATLSAGLGYMYGKYEREGGEFPIKLPKVVGVAKKEKPEIVASPDGDKKGEEKPTETPAKKSWNIEDILEVVEKM